jgi:hypothetical protein
MSGSAGMASERWELFFPRCPFLITPVVEKDPSHAYSGCIQWVRVCLTMWQEKSLCKGLWRPLGEGISSRIPAIGGNFWRIINRNGKGGFCGVFRKGSISKIRKRSPYEAYLTSGSGPPIPCASDNGMNSHSHPRRLRPDYQTGA